MVPGTNVKKCDGDNNLGAIGPLLYLKTVEPYI